MVIDKLVKLYCKQFTKLQSLPNQEHFIDYIINLPSKHDQVLWTVRSAFFEHSRSIRIVVNV